MELISNEVKAQLNAALEKEGLEPEIDFEQLDEEIKTIDFNREFETDFGIESVVFNGRLVDIHVTNNFAMIFGIISSFREGNQPSTFDQIYIEEIEHRKYKEIFDLAEKNYPNLYKMMQAISHRQQEEKDLERSDLPNEQKDRVRANAEERTAWKFYSSALYGAMAKIARTHIDTSYNLNNLY